TKRSGTVGQLPLQVFLEGAGSGVSPRRVHFQAMPHDSLGCRRNCGVKRPQAWRWSDANGEQIAHQLVDRTSRVGERLPPGEQLEQDDSKSIDVGAAVEDALSARISVQMLGGHVWQCSADHGTRARAMNIFRQVEVEKHGLSVGGEQDVSRLQVTME